MFRPSPPRGPLLGLVILALSAVSAAQADVAPDPSALDTTICRAPGFVVLALDPRQGRAVVAGADGLQRVVSRGQRLDDESLAVHQVTQDTLILSRLDELGRSTPRQVWLHPIGNDEPPLVRCLEVASPSDASKLIPWDPLDVEPGTAGPEIPGKVLRLSPEVAHPASEP